MLEDFEFVVVFGGKRRVRQTVRALNYQLAKDYAQSLVDAHNATAASEDQATLEDSAPVEAGEGQHAA